MAMLRNKDLVKLLQAQDPELPLVITRDGKSCEYGLEAEDVYVLDGAYFGNYDTKEKFDEDQKFLRIGIF